MSSLELLVYFLKLSRHFQSGIHSYILFGAPGLKEYTHISSLELLVYFLKPSIHFQSGIHSYILFGAPGLFP